MIVTNDVPYAQAATELQPGTLAIRGYLHRDPIDDGASGAYSLIQRWVEAQPPEAEITLDIDSPGGDIAGLEALCEAIAKHPGKTSAHVTGAAASAAYWIASSCDGIVADPSAIIGSVGTMLPGAMEPVSELDVVATLSPRKNAADGQWQEVIDDSCARFLRHVASRRGWPETDLVAISQRVGEGKMMTPSEALARGLIDRITDTGGHMEPDQLPEVETQGDKTLEDAVREHEARLADAERRIEELTAIIDNLKRDEADDRADEAQDKEEMLEEPAAKCDRKATAKQMAAMARALSSIQRTQRDEHVARLVAEGRIQPADAPIAKIVYDTDRAAFDKRYGRPAAMSIVSRVSSGAAAPKAQPQDPVAAAHAAMAQDPKLTFRAAYKAALKGGN